MFKTTEGFFEFLPIIGKSKVQHHVVFRSVSRENYRTINLFRHQKNASKHHEVCSLLGCGVSNLGCWHGGLGRVWQGGDPKIPLQKGCCQNWERRDGNEVSKKVLFFFENRLRLGPLVFFGCFFFWFWKGKIGNKLHASDRNDVFHFLRGGVEGHRTPKKHHQKRLMGGFTLFFVFPGGCILPPALVLEDRYRENGPSGPPTSLVVSCN